MHVRRAVPVLTLLALTACGGGEPAEEAPAAAVATALSPDEQALEDLRAYFEQHYNMHHADMVAATYTDSAWTLPAAGGLVQGRAAIQADMEAAMAGSPTVSITGTDDMVFGDAAVSMGTFQVTTTPPGGEAMTFSGNYLNLVRKVEGEWKIAGSITNYDAARPEGWTWNDAGEAPADEGTMADVVEYFETHWNMGHPDMVADAYTEDAVMAFSNGPALRGRAAVAASLTERIPPGSQLDVHDVATIPLAEGWALDGGWYQINGADGAVLQMGAYVHLMRQQPDGSWKIHRGLSNAQPPAM